MVPLNVKSCILAFWTTQHVESAAYPSNKSLWLAAERGKSAHEKRNKCHLQLFYQIHPLILLYYYNSLCIRSPESFSFSFWITKTNYRHPVMRRGISSSRHRGLWARWPSAAAFAVCSNATLLDTDDTRWRNNQASLTPAPLWCQFVRVGSQNFTDYLDSVCQETEMEEKKPPKTLIPNRIMSSCSQTDRSANLSPSNSKRTTRQKLPWAPESVS